MTIKDTILTERSPTLLFTLSCEREEEHPFVCEKKKLDWASDSFLLSTKTHDTPLTMSLFAKIS